MIVPPVGTPVIFHVCIADTWFRPYWGIVIGKVEEKPHPVIDRDKSVDKIVEVVALIAIGRGQTVTVQERHYSQRCSASYWCLMDEIPPELHDRRVGKPGEKLEEILAAAGVLET